MDSFTIAVVIGMGVMLVIFLGLIVVDKGAPAPRSGSKSAKK